jgi:hypothetical protein
MSSIGSSLRKKANDRRYHKDHPPNVEQNRVHAEAQARYTHRQRVAASLVI